MAVVDRWTWLEYIPPATCWELLAQAKVGRFGVLVDSAPEVYPVNFVVDHGTIVFRTDAGNKLRSVHRSPSVCFEVDQIDVDRETGWSVLVKGRATELTTAEEVSQVMSLPVRPWALGSRPHWIRIVPEEVTGRRIHPGQGPPTGA